MEIYLDNAATTKPRQEVIEAMTPYFTEKWHNPSSLYSVSTNIKRDIENARRVVGTFINANSDEIFFTSSGSEGNCWAIQGLVNQCVANGGTPSVVTSVIEHKSVLDCVENLNNVDVHFIGVNESGYINIRKLEDIVRKEIYSGKIVLVSIQFANNEIGTIQWIKEIAEMVHKYGAVFHTDAVQAFGNISIDVKELGIDMMTVSGHKIGTPKGIGFLYKKNNIKIKPLIYGSQMDSMRGGTENVPYIIGMAKAVEILKREIENNYIDTFNIRGYMFEKLCALGCKFNGSMFNRLPNNISATFPQNITGESLVYMLDTCDIYISTGSACNSKSIEPSYVLKAIGLSDEDAMRTIRISLSSNNTKDQIDKVICEIKKQIKLLEV